MASLPASIRALVEKPDSERVIGPFHLVRQLGRGGFAPVWMAREVYGGVEVRTAAVKLFAMSGARAFEGAGYTDGEASRVIEEARALCRVQHPHVVRFFSLILDEDRGVAGLAMEHVAGEPLDATLRRTTSLPQTDVIDIGIALASALAAVHREGLIHRDVKPANVIDDSGEYKLIDFGIAHPPAAQSKSRKPKVTVVDDVPILLDETEVPSESGASSGTFGYIDPESIATGAPASTASDLYGLGATLFECLSGKIPAAASMASGLRTEILDGRATAPEVSALVSGVSEGLSRCIAKLLEPTRAKRTKSADAVVSELLAARDLLTGVERALPPESVGPFRGLGRFEESDRDVYFGRSADVASAQSLLHAQGLVALIGPSGSGKSSLARAGVLPAVQASGLGRAPKIWRTITLSPGNDPRRAITEALSPLVEIGPTADPAAALQSMVSWAESSQEGVLLFVDQLEELVTLSEETSATWSAQLLAGIGERPHFGVRALVAARRDLLDGLLAFPSLGKVLARGAMFVAPLTDAVWADVLDQALGAYGYRFEDEALRAEVLDQLHGSIEAMPLVQFALTELWEQRDVAEKTIPRASLRNIGGIAGALGRHADATLAEIERKIPEGTELARALLLSLTTPEGTRATRTESELERVAPASRPIVQELETARLIVREGGGYTLAHEALLTSWTTLREWVDESRDERRLEADLERAAGDWTRTGDETLLWRERRLDAALSRSLSLSEQGERFLKSSERREERARRLAIGGVVLALLALVGGVGIYVRSVTTERAATREAMATAQKNEKNADTARDRANAESRRLILSNASAALDSDATLAIARLRELPPQGSDWNAARLIASVARARGIAREVVPVGGRIWEVVSSADGKRLGTRARELRVWNPADWTFKRLEKSDPTWAATTLAISHDGKTFAADGNPETSTVQVWGPDGAATYASPGHGRSVLQFVAGDLHILTIRDDTAIVLNLETQTQLTLPGSKGRKTWACASLDGRRYAEVNGAHIDVWDTTTGSRLDEFATPDGLTGFAVGPDGSVAASTKSGVRVFDRATGHTERLTSSNASLEFSQSGDFLLAIKHTAFTGDTISLYPRGVDQGFSDATVSVFGQTEGGAIDKAMLSRDERSVLARTQDGSLWVWDRVRGGAPSVRHMQGDRSIVTSIAELDDGTVVAADERSLRTWSVASSPVGQLALAPPAKVSMGGYVERLRLSSDGRRALALTGDKRLLSCDLERLPCETVDAPGSVIADSLLVSADGSRAMWRTKDAGVQLLESDRLRRVLPGTSRAIAVDGSRGLDTVAFVTESGAAFVLTGGLDVPVSTNAPFAVEGVEVADNGRSLALLGAQESAVYDVGSGSLWMLPTKHVIGASFRPEGDALLLVEENKDSGTRVSVWHPWDLSPVPIATTGKLVEMSFRGRPMAIFDHGATLDLLDAETGERRRLPKESAPVSFGRFSPDQGTFVYGSDLGTRLCDVPSWTCLPMPRAPGNRLGLAWDVAFASDGTIFLAGVDGVDTFRDDLPRDPAMLRAWLEASTNMYVDRDDAPTHCSQKDSAPIQLTATNGSDRTIAVYVVDENCSETFSGTLAPGGTFRQRTFVHQPWRFRDAGTHDVVLDFPGASTAENVNLAVKDEIAGTGFLAPAVIQASVRRSFPLLRACYEAGLKRHPTLAGKVAVRFAIDEGGRVLNASDGGSDLPDKAVISCVIDVFWRMTFPAGGHSGANVVYPIAFTPEN